MTAARSLLPAVLGRRRAVPLLLGARLRALPRSPLALTVLIVVVVVTLLALFAPPARGHPCHPASGPGKPRMTCTPGSARVQAGP
jgi:hypothetical protein